MSAVEHDPRANEAIVLAFFAALARGAVDDLADFFHEDATMTTMARSELRFHGGRDQFLEVTRRVIAKSVERSMSVTGVTAAGERVAVEVEGRYVFADGREYANFYHMLFVVRRGRIAVIREYSDTLHAQQAFPMEVFLPA